MSSDDRERQARIAGREAEEPEELHNPVPWPFAVFALAMIAWGAAYFFLEGEAPLAAGDRRTPIAAPQADAVDGGAIYAGNCASCHQANGQGLPGVFPPLDGSEWVLGRPEIPIQILLHGLGGSIEVAGKRYQGVMPPFGSQLSDAEIAAVLSHVRGSWSNQAGPISAEDVARERKRFGERGPWQGEEELRRVLGAPGG